MKNDLPYFSHDNNARNHPKLKALKGKYSWEGLAKFWALCEIIAETNGAFIDISRKINKLNLISELDFNEIELDEFLSFLSDPEIDLINIQDNKITTDRINELHKEVMNKREQARNKKQQKKNKQESSIEKDNFSEEKQESSIELNNKEKEIKEEENKENKNISGSFSENSFKYIPEESQETKEDATTLFNKARNLWNELKVPPNCRDIIIPHTQSDCLRTLQNYLWLEIENAIKNYDFHKKQNNNDWKPPPPYGSLYGFLKTGVERYFDNDAFKQQFYTEPIEEQKMTNYSVPDVEQSKKIIEEHKESLKNADNNNSLVEALREIYRENNNSEV